MQWTLYLRLIVLTAGTLLPFFWMVVILGHRRQRNFERLFFFLCLALTCFFWEQFAGAERGASLRGATGCLADVCVDISVSWAMVCAFADSPLARRVRQCERFVALRFRKIFVDRSGLFAGDPADGGVAARAAEPTTQF